MKLAILMIPIIAVLTGCDSETSDHKQTTRQAALTSEAVQEVGMPAISNWQDMRMAKSILEARDQTISTVTYVFAENSGQMFKLCDSVGYGLPYATQYTSPMRPAKAGEVFGSDNITVPQADPNGLFSPAAADATWIFCVDPATKKDKPVYVEPKTIVSPFPLQLTPVEFARPESAVAPAK